MLLERFGLWEARRERASSLSRGQLQRLALCRAVLHRPELLILDEPFTGLDADGAELLDRELAAMRGRRTLLVSTHDPQRVAPLQSGALALA
jgi:ABC-type multidrug transport system ATPase subunit